MRILCYVVGDSVWELIALSETIILKGHRRIELRVYFRGFVAGVLQIIRSRLLHLLHIFCVDGIAAHRT